MYAEQKQRQTLEETFSDITDFLQSLDMKVTVKNIDEFTLPRIGHLRCLCCSQLAVGIVELSLGARDRTQFVRRSGGSVRASLVCFSGIPDAKRCRGWP